MEHTESTEGWAITPAQVDAELERQRKEVLKELQAVPESEVVQLQAEVARLKDALGQYGVALAAWEDAGRTAELRIAKLEARIALADRMYEAAKYQICQSDVEDVDESILDDACDAYRESGNPTICANVEYFSDFVNPDAIREINRLNEKSEAPIWRMTPEQFEAELARQAAEIGRLRAALEKIADWHGHWGPFPEKREDWRSMAIVTAREAVPQSRPGRVIHTFSTTKCGCLKCIQTRGDKSPSGLPLEATMMIVCPKCGDKRCPHAEDHSKECTK